MGQIRPLVFKISAAAGLGVLSLLSLQPAAWGEISPYGATSVASPPLKETGLLRPNFLGTEFVYESYRDAISQGGQKQTSYPAVKIRGRGEKEWGSFGMYGEAEALAGINNFKYSYFNNIPEAYVGSSKSVTGFRTHFGRKLEDWSSIDDYWMMGIWQPRFRWNYIEPENVGLTGLFLSQKFETVRFTAFATPIYIPEFGAPIAEENGQLTSQHPFFNPPPNSMQVFGETTPLRYTIEIPPLQRIVYNPGAGTMIRVGRDFGWFGKAGYGYMPINQLIMAYEGFLYHPTGDVAVRLYPRVVYHHIANFETGYRSKRFESWVAAMGEIPVDSTLPTGRTSQVVRRGAMASATIGYNFFGEGESATGLSGSVLQTWGGVADDSGPLASPGQQILESRYSYRTAVSGRAKISILNTARQSLAYHGRAVYDFSVYGTILSSEFRYRFNKSWTAVLGADVLGAARDRAQTNGGGADYLGMYRAQDRIRGGIGYVF